MQALKRGVWICVAIALLLANVRPTIGVDNLLCVPNPTQATTGTLTNITTADDKILKGKFFYPNPGSGNAWTANSLPGIVMAHGFPGNDGFASFEDDARELASLCFVVLLFNFRGQGPHDQVNSQFTFYSQTERDDLRDVTDWLVAGPPLPINIVDSAQLGFIGFSQGAVEAWTVIADPTLRHRFKAVIPYDGDMNAVSHLAPNGCLFGHLSQFFDPENYRTPWPDSGNTPTATQPGVSWLATQFSSLSTAYLVHTPNASLWQSEVSTRTPLDELATPNNPSVPTPTPPGATFTPVPHPHVFAQFHYYDTSHYANEVIPAMQTLQAPTTTPDYPAKRIYIFNSGAHSDWPWDPTGPTQAALREQRAAWMLDHMRPVYASTPTPTPTWTPGGPTPTHTPTATPSPLAFEAQIDSFNNTPDPPNSPNTTPTLEWVRTNNYPPAATPVTFYFHAGNLALTITPQAGSAFDTVKQVYTPGATAWNLGTAVAEGPPFETWPTHIFPTPANYRTERLRQDITIVEPPDATLWVEPVDLASQTYQVHVRVHENLSGTVSSAVPTPYITRANACAWNEPTPPANQTATPISVSGEARGHKFQKGSRIIFVVTTVDREEFWPANSRLAITPYLGAFELKLFRYSDKPSSVTLRIIPEDAGIPIFEADALGRPGGASAAATPTPPPARAQPASEPLTIVPYMSEATNPGGWRAWATELSFICSGGVAPVSCPAPQLLMADGYNMSFTGEARDAAGNVATVTASGISIDRTPPVLSESLPETRTYCSGSTLTLDYSVGDALSGMRNTSATFNTAPATNGQSVALRAGKNTLRLDAEDIAGNRAFPEAAVQVDYDETLAFPPNGTVVVPGAPLAYQFSIADACAANGKYGGATGTLWLTGPSGVEQAAEWYGAPTGNTFTYDALTTWYSFDAETASLAPGTWAARAHLDDGNDYSTTFVVP